MKLDDKSQRQLDTERSGLSLFRGLMDATPAQCEQALSAASLDPQIVSRVRKMLVQHHANSQQQIAQLAHAMFQSIPAEIGPFRITGVLGEGGMGRVLRGTRPMDRGEQQVAIKIVYAPNANPLRGRFLRERELLARLQHPAIAALIDFGETPDGLLWYAMALIDGVLITAFVEASNASTETIVALIIDLCEVLHYAHGLGVIHRDVKPQNVLVSADGSLHLIDFGIAKALQDADNLSELGHSPMTPRYASPEQRRSGSITTASDQWQIGALAFELLTRQKLSDDPSVESPRVRQLNRAVSLDLDAVVMKALREAPGDRYHSSAEFAHDLRAAQNGAPVRARMDENWYLLRVFVKQYRWIIAGAALALISLILASALIFRAAESAKMQARIANRSNELLAEIFLSDDQGANLEQMTLGSFIGNGVARVIQDQELPIPVRMKLLDELAERASESGEYIAAEAGSREVLRLASLPLSSSASIPEQITIAQASASLAAILLNSPRRIELDVEIKGLIRNATITAPVQTQSQAQQAISARRAAAFYAAYQNDFNAALAHANYVLAQSKLWLAHDPWAIVLAMRTQAVMLSAANRASESADAYRLLLNYADQQSALFPKLENTVQWDRAELCSELSKSQPAQGLLLCQANLDRLANAQQMGSMLMFENLSGQGRSLARLNRSAEALVCYQRAEAVLIALEGDASVSLKMASIRRRIGTRLIDLGKAEQAVLPLNFALSVVRLRLAEHAPEQDEIRAELAQALLRSGQLKRAKAAFDEIKTPLAMPEQAQARYAEIQASL